MKSHLPNDAPGLVAVLNNRPDFERAAMEHWYRIPVQTAPEGVEKIRWIAFYLTQAFGRDKWAVRHWATVDEISRLRRIDLLPSESRHPRSQNLYYRIALGPCKIAPNQS